MMFVCESSLELKVSIDDLLGLKRLNYVIRLERVDFDLKMGCSPLRLFLRVDVDRLPTARKMMACFCRELMTRLLLVLNVHCCFSI